jgi:hypothetical protein
MVMVALNFLLAGLYKPNTLQCVPAQSIPSNSKIFTPTIEEQVASVRKHQMKEPDCTPEWKDTNAGAV